MTLFAKKTEEALVVAFDSTASALVFQSRAGDFDLEGRLVPVPRSLSSGCGMAWRDNLDARPHVEELLADESIDDARIVVMDLRP